MGDSWIPRCPYQGTLNSPFRDPDYPDWKPPPEGWFSIWVSGSGIKDWNIQSQQKHYIKKDYFATKNQPTNTLVQIKINRPTDCSCGKKRKCLLVVSKLVVGILCRLNTVFLIGEEPATDQPINLSPSVSSFSSYRYSYAVSDGVGSWRRIFRKTGQKLLVSKMSHTRFLIPILGWARAILVGSTCRF